jgi:hypothetical protein
LPTSAPPSPSGRHCFRFLKTFFRGGVVSPTPNPQLGGPGFRVYIHRRQGCPAISGHCVARVPRDRQFPYPLTWAPEGLTKFTPYKFSTYCSQRTWPMQLPDIPNFKSHVDFQFLRCSEK